jgi:hypothetical protein
MKRLLGWIFLVECFLNSFADAQINRGTIGIMFFNQNKVIMVADSRVLAVGAHVPPDDSACKIATLNNQIVFFAANVSGFSIDTSRFSPVEPWTATGDIRRVYKTLSEKNPKEIWVGAVADEWGKFESQRLRGLYEFEPRQVIAATDNGILTVAYVGGIDVPGYLIAFQVNITFDNIRRPPVQYRVEPILCGSAQGCYSAAGQTDVFTEYTGFRSDRAKLESLSWNSGRAFSRTFQPKDLDIIRTIRLVDLTLAFHKGSDVGGKIDAVELSRDGKIRWFARKQNCE